MVHSAVQSVGLVGTTGARENSNAIPAGPLKEACPYRVPGTREQKCTFRHAGLVGARFQLVRLEPGRGEDVGLDDGASSDLGHSWLWYIGSCGKGGGWRRRTGRVGGEGGGRHQRRGRSGIKEVMCMCGRYCHRRGRIQAHFGVERVEEGWRARPS